MYLNAVFVFIVICYSTVTANLGRRSFFNAVRCSFVELDDLQNGTSIDVFLYKPYRGFLLRQEDNQANWTGQNLLTTPTTHVLTCRDSQNKATCSLRAKLNGNDNDLFVKVFRTGRFWYSRVSSNVIIKYYSRRRVLVFFDRRTRRFITYAYPVALGKISGC